MVHLYHQFLLQQQKKAQGDAGNVFLLAMMLIVFKYLARAVFSKALEKRYKDYLVDF